MRKQNLFNTDNSQATHDQQADQVNFALEDDAHIYGGIGQGDYGGYSQSFEDLINSSRSSINYGYTGCSKY